FFPPLVETVSGNNTAASIDERLEGRQLCECLGSRVDHPVTDGRVCGPMWNQTPMHEPALVSASVSDNDGNRRRSLFGGNITAGRVLWQSMVEVPTNPDVAKLARCCETATH